MLPALSITDLSKTYKDGTQALKGVSLEVSEGDFFGLLGPNGAGKSTTLSILTSLVNKTSGSIEVFGKNTDTHFSEAKHDLGVVPQEFNFNQFEKVFDIVVTQAGYYGIPRALAKERAEKYLKQLGLWDKRSTQARSLSGGMKRRLMIARALVHQPRILILDEPTAGVDIELRRSMWQFLEQINAEGTTIILTTHYLEEAESLCRNIAIINNGEIIQNTSTKELLRQLNSETFVFDVAGQLDQLPDVPGYELKRIDDHTFEAVVDKSQGLNALFGVLAQQNLQIASMRNKANRLEELFVSLVGQ